jgi:hypothetical protein
MLIITTGWARNCSKQLFGMVCDQLGSWNAQEITNAMWACGVLGLVDTPFLIAAVAAAKQWVPHSTTMNLNQAATACVELQYRDEQFMSVVLQRGLQLLSQQPRGRQGHSSRPIAPADRDRLGAYCPYAIAMLDMPSLAGAAGELVSISGVGQRSSTHPVSLAKLWVFHSWLLQHQLLDGKGLEGLLTQQQLQRGARDAAALGMC